MSIFARIVQNVTLRSMAYGVLSAWVASIGFAGAFATTFDFNYPGAIPTTFTQVFMKALGGSMLLSSFPSAVAAIFLSILFRSHAVKKKLSTIKAVLLGSGLGVITIWFIVEIIDFLVGFFSWKMWIFYITSSGILALLAGGWTAWRIFGLIGKSTVPDKMQGNSGTAGETVQIFRI